MPTPGYVFRDGQPIPDSDRQPNEAKEQKQDGKGEEVAKVDYAVKRAEVAKTSQTAQKPLPPTTDSHALATADHELKGAAQEDHDASNVKDTGWKKNAEGVRTLVGGLPNEELWTLIRRFNKVCLSISRNFNSANLFG